MSTKLPYLSISSLKAEARRHGSHFFDKDTMYFFHSVIGKKAFAGSDGWYFITSEQREYYTERKYSVRRYSPQGKIDTIGQFHSYDTSEQATDAAKRLAELSLSDTTTCPTANGTDLALWEQIRSA